LEQSSFVDPLHLVTLLCRTVGKKRFHIFHVLSLVTVNCHVLDYGLQSAGTQYKRYRSLWIFSTVNLNTLLYLTSRVGRLLHLPSTEAVSARPNVHPECNHKVTASGYKAIDGYEGINRRL